MNNIEDFDVHASLYDDPAFSEYFSGTYKRRKHKGIQAEINKMASHLDVVDLNSKLVVARNTWNLFEKAYQYVGGFQSYADFEDMANTASYIRVVYDGKLDNIDEFDVNKCYAVGTYNTNHGLKMAAIASLRDMDPTKRKAALRKLKITSFRFSWVECSDKAESFVLSCGGGKYIISPEIIKEKIYPERDIEIDKDGKHYYRVLTQSGKRVKKLAVGNIKY